mgnify:CR=1 FL=1
MQNHQSITLVMQLFTYIEPTILCSQRNYESQDPDLNTGNNNSFMSIVL